MANSANPRNLWKNFCSPHQNYNPNHYLTSLHHRRPTTTMSDRHNRVGSKPGAGGIASRESMALARKSRLRDLAMETSDLSKDPYFMRNHLGTFECKLCSTLHTNEGNYLAHTQGKRHQSNLARRAHMEGIKTKVATVAPEILMPKIVKIGRPGFRVERTQDAATGQRVLRFEIDFPRIEKGIQPRHRLMSAYEQRVEPADNKWQYLLVAAIPYQTIGFKIPNEKIDRRPGKFSTSWNAGNLTFVVVLQYENKLLGSEDMEVEVIGASANAAGNNSSSSSSSSSGSGSSAVAVLG
jgi:splicing factor 3A subunit 2